MAHFSPLVSIIISVKHGAKTLRYCIDSILSQSYSHKELIIIDGASSDATVDIIRSFTKHIDYWVSEPDTGIYAAWNKGLARARGQYVSFLGCDDQYAEPSTLEDLAGILRPDSDLVSGRVALVNSAGVKYRIVGSEWNWNITRHRMAVAFPGAILSKSRIMRMGGFDEGFVVSSDYKMIMAFGPECRAAFLDRVVVHMGDRGISKTAAHLALFETARIQIRSGHVATAEASFYLGVGILKHWVRVIISWLATWFSVTRI